MLNISGIHEGFVLDHIKAGMSLQIYHDLKLDELDCTVAIIKNAKSSKMGKKDILKVIRGMPDRSAGSRHPRLHRSQYHSQRHQGRQDL